MLLPVIEGVDDTVTDAVDVAELEIVLDAVEVNDVRKHPTKEPRAAAARAALITAMPAVHVAESYRVPSTENLKAPMVSSARL